MQQKYYNKEDIIHRRTDMERFEWKNVVIERHFLVFDGISCDNLSKYEYTVEDLKKDPVIVIKGHELPDFIMSVNSLTEHGISFFESIKGSAHTVAIEPYESHGVIILNSEDEHKTPTITLSYNKSVFYTVSVI
jgi:hypothetical protein